MVIRWATGYQFIGGKKNKLVHEIAFNLGFKVVNYTEFDKITEADQHLIKLYEPTRSFR